MKLFLIGMPGSGKSTIARKIADLKGISFYDTDDLIQKKYQLKISDIFKKYGEIEFRKYEKTLLEEFSEKDNFIAATGGGMPCFNENMKRMNQLGITIYLKTNSNILFQRLRLSSERPLLYRKNDKELSAYLEKTLKKREPYYLQAKNIIDANKKLKEISESELFNF